MKKSLFMLAAGALAFTACTSSDVLEEGVQSNAIGFNTHVEKASRALETSNFNSFRVYGNYKTASSDLIQVFNNVAVTKTGDDWGYSNTRYWIAGATYNFAAYATENGLNTGAIAGYNLNEDGDAYVLGIEGFRADGNVQKDLLYAEANDILAKESGNETVNFNFKHILSRLKFTFVSGFPRGYRLQIYDVKLQNMRNIGDFDGTAWNAKRETPVQIPFTFEGASAGEVAIADGTTEAKTITSNYAFVLPWHYTGTATVNIVFNARVYFGDNTDPVLTILGIEGSWKPNWELGKSYAYTITVNGSEAGLEPIEFAGTVADWDGDNEYAFSISGGEVNKQETPAE